MGIHVRVGPSLLAVVSLLVACVWRAFPAQAQQAPPAPAPEISRALQELGLENVAVTPEAGALRVEYENRRFRYEMDAAAAVMRAVAAAGVAGRVTIVPKNTNVPLLSISFDADAYRNFAAGGMAAAEFARGLVVSPSPGSAAGDLAAPSFSRPDLQIAPAVDYVLGELSRGEYHTKGKLTVRPSATVQVSPGLSATGRVKMDLTGDTFYGDRAMVAWTGRSVGRPLFYSVKAGRLQRQDDGLVGEVLWCGRGDQTRVHAVIGQVWPRPWETTQRQLTASIQHDLPGGDRTLDLTGGRFLDGDDGVGLTFTRRFGQSRVSIGYLRTSRNRLGVFSLSAPFGPRARAPVGRLRPTADIPFEYRAPEDPEIVLDAGRRIETGSDLVSFRKGWTVPYALGHADELVAAARPGESTAMGTPGQAGAEALSGVGMDGTSGAIRTPVADVVDMGTASVGLGLHRRVEVEAPGSPLIGERALPAHVLVGLFPRTEASLRIAFFEDGSIDRTLNLQHLLRPQSGSRPAIAVGWQGAGQNVPHRGRVSGQQYVVATWRRSRGRVSIGLGHSASGADSRLDGPFASAQAQLSRTSWGTVEYDGEGTNAGVTIRPTQGLSLTCGLLDGRRLGGNLAVGWQLQ